MSPGTWTDDQWLEALRTTPTAEPLRPPPPPPFTRRDVPRPLCACPLNTAPCWQPANGEDRLCGFCREKHDPDGVRR